MSRKPLPPLRFTVAFDDCDSEGIVFFGNFFRLAHRALEAHLPRLGIPWTEWFKNTSWGVPLRHAEADFLRPLRPGEVFDVKISVAEIGESSVHFAYEFLSVEGKPMANLKTSHVFVSRSEMKKVDVPTEIRTRLS